MLAGLNVSSHIKKKVIVYNMLLERLKFSTTRQHSGEVQRLQADIRKDLNLLRQAQKAFTSNLRTYQQQVRNLSKAPLEDIKPRIDKYAPSPEGLAIKGLVLGKPAPGSREFPPPDPQTGNYR